MDTKPIHSQFATKVLILFLIEGLINFFLPISIIFYIIPYIILYFTFAAALIFMLYKNVKVAWYIFIIYFALNLIFGGFTLSMIYKNLLQYPDANWGGFLTFIIPTLPLIFYIVGLRIGWQKETRHYFKIRLRKKSSES